MLNNKMNPEFTVAGVGDSRLEECIQRKLWILKQEAHLNKVLESLTPEEYNEYLHKSYNDPLHMEKLQSYLTLINKLGQAAQQNLVIAEKLKKIREEQQGNDKRDT